MFLLKPSFLVDFQSPRLITRGYINISSLPNQETPFKPDEGFPGHAGRITTNFTDMCSKPEGSNGKAMAFADVRIRSSISS